MGSLPQPSQRDAHSPSVQPLCSGPPVAAHIARLGESLAAEAALGVQSHHCAWALLHFAAFMADCQKVDAGDRHMPVLHIF